MNPQLYACISGDLQKIVDLDSITRRTRSIMDIDNDDRRTMESYQSMQVQCLQESARKRNENCLIHLCDILIVKYSLPDEDLKRLKIIINFNKGGVKSLLLSDSDNITTFVQSLDQGVFNSLETLRVEECRKEPVWLPYILTESARALKCLTLTAPSFQFMSLSDISITALEGLTCLKSVYLDSVCLTHNNLQCFYSYISQTSKLTQLKLAVIHCSDHEGQYRDCGVTLDLRRQNKLKLLHLVVPCWELYVNPACLEELEFCPWGGMTASASATMWQDLRGAPVLSSLTLCKMKFCQEMKQTIPTLTQLQYFRLHSINMGNVIPQFSPAMTKLERVELIHVTMSSAGWQKLLFSVGGLTHPVMVRLHECNVISREEWQVIVDVIKTMPAFSLL